VHVLSVDLTEFLKHRFYRRRQFAKCSRHSTDASWSNKLTKFVKYNYCPRTSNVGHAIGLSAWHALWLDTF